MSQEPTVFVVDDDDQARSSLCALVESMGLQCKSFTSGESFLKECDRSQPGCLVADLMMPGGMNGIELMERLREERVPLPVIIITAHAKTQRTVRAMQRGAVTLLEKPYDAQQLEVEIREAIELGKALRQTEEAKEEVRLQLRELTESEREVLNLIVAGQANKVIASKLGISIRTVESRRHNIFQKLDAKSVAEVVRKVVAVEPERIFDGAKDDQAEG